MERHIMCYDSIYFLDPPVFFIGANYLPFFLSFFALILLSFQSHLLTHDILFLYYSIDLLISFSCSKSSKYSSLQRRPSSSGSRLLLWCHLLPVFVSLPVTFFLTLQTLKAYFYFWALARAGFFLKYSSLRVSLRPLPHFIRASPQVSSLRESFFVYSA